MGLTCTCFNQIDEKQNLEANIFQSMSHNS